MARKTENTANFLKQTPNPPSVRAKPPLTPPAAYSGLKTKNVSAALRAWNYVTFFGPEFGRVKFEFALVALAFAGTQTLFGRLDGTKPHARDQSTAIRWHHTWCDCV